MTNFQITLVRIDNGGPWTVTPDPRRKTDIQALQAQSYTDLVEFVGGLSGDAGSAQDESRRSIFRGVVLEEDERHLDDVEIAHFDTIDATPTYTDEHEAFDSFLRIVGGYHSPVDNLYENRESPTFLTGDDNVAGICPGLGSEEYRAAIEHVERSVGIPLQAGIGQGRTVQQAGVSARRALETCRENETRLEGTAAKGDGGETDR